MSERNEPRTKRIRFALSLSQAEMAKRLRVSQPTVWNLEHGQKESGPVAFMLDMLEAELSRSPASSHPTSDSEVAA
ncbi:hypothetical protein CH337_13075 [Rhodoblastus acidophilus]|nr:hypothetical protein CKO16_20460 [Rhodoblastus acidophilus]RAI18851.1 hypothetical protein CH337_13075 [Rhodoblastus acidophilus]